jgi:hypothetical protein
LTTSQIAALTTAEITAFTTAQIAALTTDQLVNLTSAELQALTTAQIGKGLSTAQIAALTSGEMARLKTNQIAALTTRQIALGLTSAQVANLTTAEIRALTTAQLVALTTVQIEALTPTECAALTTAQTRSLTVPQKYVLTTAQSQAMVFEERRRAELPAGSVASVAIPAAAKAKAALGRKVGELVQEIASFKAQPSSSGKASATMPALSHSASTGNSLAIATNVDGIVNLLRQFDRNGNAVALGSVPAMANGQFNTENFASLKTGVLFNAPVGKVLAGK